METHRTTHYIAISDGQIALRFIGDRHNGPEHSFVDETEAARALAQAFVASGSTRILNSSSVDFPDEDGRPGFNYDAFLRRVRGFHSGLLRAAG